MTLIIVCLEVVISIARVIIAVAVMVAETWIIASMSNVVAVARITASEPRMSIWSLQHRFPLQRLYDSVCKQFEWRIGMEFRYYDKMKRPYEKGSG